MEIENLIEAEIKKTISPRLLSLLKSYTLFLRIKEALNESSNIIAKYWKSK